MDEHELNRRAIAGNDEAFLALMHLHKEALLRTALAFLKNEHDALEALQEVTYRAYKKIHTVKQPDYLKTWLIRIMMNYCNDYLKKNRRLVFGEAHKEAGSDMPDRLEISEALSCLPSAEQQLIHLKYFQDVKIKDIAAMENIPEGTVKSRLHKTLRTLRGHFTEKEAADHV
ncbi:sigma-70 family RNA polymerase sigma factor [Planococcus sp. FY231025]|uniref:sigma-70 family RNA polymerase sigma factor n=1 Tax=Planococcus sp. FY231025 TaxID=3455699 RepID=UPI003F935FDD